MSDSPELRRIRQQVRTSYDIEDHALSWALNPERDRLRRDLPFIAEALDYCARRVGKEKIDGMAAQYLKEQAQRNKEEQAANMRAHRSNRLRSETLRRTLQLKKVDREIDGKE